MLRTIRFMGRYSGQLAAVFAVFAAIIVAGCWFTGTQGGLFGSYAAGFFIFSVIFSVLSSSTLDAYMNVALSMGARRGQCFWAVELCSIVNLLILVGLSALVRWAIAPLPGEEAMYEPDWKVWLLLIATGLFFGQLGMLMVRIEHPRWRALGLMAVMLLCGGTSVVLMLCNILERFTRSGVLMNGMLIGFPLGAVAMGAVVYDRYRKAVVRV